MIKNVLVVGGANGIGLAIACELAARKETKTVYVVDKAPIDELYMHPKFDYIQFDLTNEDYSIFDTFDDINSLIITAGFGQLALFKDVSERYIIDSFNVNAISVLRIIKHFYYKLEAQDIFYCGVMDSIAGWMSSPLFAVYGATKASLKIFIESVNVELKKSGSKNVILNVSPGLIKGSKFYGKSNNLEELQGLSHEIIMQLEAHSDLYIPKYDEIYRDVLERYHKDFRAEGSHSYEFKIQSGRIY